MILLHMHKQWSPWASAFENAKLRRSAEVSIVHVRNYYMLLSNPISVLPYPVLLIYLAWLYAMKTWRMQISSHVISFIAVSWPFSRRRKKYADALSSLFRLERRLLPFPFHPASRGSCFFAPCRTGYGMEDVFYYWGSRQTVGWTWFYIHTWALGSTIRMGFGVYRFYIWYVLYTLWDSHLSSIVISVI